MAEHIGHRQRLKERYLKDGIDGFAEHEVLEMLLFYAIPQMNTNEIAHRLLEQFGSLHCVFEAKRDDLCKVKGIGDHAATLLQLIPDISRRYSMSQLTEKEIKLYTPQDIADFLRPNFIGRKTENMYMMCFSSEGELLCSKLVFEGAIDAVQIHMREIIKTALDCDAADVIVAHNHPIGLALPSRADINATSAIIDALDLVGVKLIDHFIFAITGEISLRSSSGFAKIFDSE